MPAGMSTNRRGERETGPTHPPGRGETETHIGTERPGRNKAEGARIRRDATAVVPVEYVQRGTIGPRQAVDARIVRGATAAVRVKYVPRRTGCSERRHCRQRSREPRGAGGAHQVPPTNPLTSA